MFWLAVRLARLHVDVRSTIACSAFFRMLQEKATHSPEFEGYAMASFQHPLTVVLISQVAQQVVFALFALGSVIYTGRELPRCLLLDDFECDCCAVYLNSYKPFDTADGTTDQASANNSNLLLADSQICSHSFRLLLS